VNVFFSAHQRRHAAEIPQVGKKIKPTEMAGK